MVIKIDIELWESMMKREWRHSWEEKSDIEQKEFIDTIKSLFEKEGKRW